jgi:hypothetical protein
MRMVFFELAFPLVSSSPNPKLVNPAGHGTHIFQSVDPMRFFLVLNSCDPERARDRFPHLCFCLLRASEDPGRC